jgi:hypothetical protein
MAVLHGLNAKIQVTSTPSVALAATEACTAENPAIDKRWYITAPTKRLLDPNYPPVVQVNRGAGFVTETTGFSILYGGGVISWPTAQTDITGVQLTSAARYFPFADWENATGWTLNYDHGFIEYTRLNKAWKERIPSVGTASCSIKGYYSDNFFWLNNGAYVGLKLYETTGSPGKRWEVLGQVKGDTINNPQDNLQDLTIEFDVVGEPNYATYSET